MHEGSIVRSLLSQVETMLEEHSAVAVHEIKIQIGPLSGVEEALVNSAFEELSPYSSVAGAELVIETVDLTARCLHCESEFALEDFVFQCPICQCNEVQVTGGDSIELVSVTLDAHDSNLVS